MSREFEVSREIDLPASPDDVWTAITSDGLGIEPHPEWSWWAMRGQLIDSPGYMANYALSAIIAAAVRARIAEVRGPWLTVCLPASTRIRLTLTLALRTRPPSYATPFDGTG